MALKQTAEEHQVDPEQLRMGVEIEKEHYPDMAHRIKIAVDHLKEFPDYYTRLNEMEKEAEDEKEEVAEKSEKAEPKKKTEMEEDDERSEKAWRSLSEKSVGTAIEANPKEEYFPSVSIDLGSCCDYKVGEEIEISFKAEVDGINKTKEGHRVCLKLKEIKE